MNDESHPLISPKPLDIDVDQLNHPSHSFYNTIDVDLPFGVTAYDTGSQHYDSDIDTPFMDYDTTQTPLQKVRYFLQRSVIYHVCRLLVHFLVLFNALFSSVMLFIEYYQIDLPIVIPVLSARKITPGEIYNIGSSITRNLSPFTVLSLSSCIFYTSLTTISILTYCYLTYTYYKLRAYFPYTGSSHWLFIYHRVILSSRAIPSRTLYFSQKLLLLSLGYLFAILPFSNLLRNITLRSFLHSLLAHNQQLNNEDGGNILSNLIANGNHTLSSSPTPSSSYNLSPAMDYVYNFHNLLIIIQLCVTFYDWIIFSAFYACFIAEVLARFFCFPCCLFRPRLTATPVESDGHCFASSYTDPIFYIPYKKLYELM